MQICKVISILSVLGLVSCSSNQKTGDEKTDALIAHMGKGTQVIGKDFDEKFNKDGFINGEFVAIGTATSADLDYLVRPLKVRAEANATASLLNSAPSEFKRIIVSAIDTASGDEGSVQESQIRVVEVKALTGIKSNFDDTQCIKTASPNQDMKYNFSKECRVIVRIPASKLMEAYNYTLDKKYSVKQKNEIQNHLLDQMGKRSESISQSTPIQAQAN